MTLLETILVIIWFISTVLNFLTGISLLGEDCWSKSVRKFDFANFWILFLVPIIFVLSAQGMPIKDKLFLLFPFYSINLIFGSFHVVAFYSSNWKKIIGLSKSKQKWIRKSFKKVDALSYFKKDKIIVGIYDKLMKILLLCREYDIPEYHVSSLFDTDLNYMIDAYTSYLDMKEKNKLCEAAISTEKKEMAGYLERFESQVSKKYEDLQEMIKNQEYTNGDFAELHSKMAQFESIFPREDERDKSVPENLSHKRIEEDQGMPMQMQ